MFKSPESASNRAQQAYGWSLAWIALVFGLGDWETQAPVWSGIAGLCVEKMGALDPQALAESGAWGWALLQVARLFFAIIGWGAGPSIVWESFKRCGILVLVAGVLVGVWVGAVAAAAPGLGVGLGPNETRAVLLGLEGLWQIAGPAFLAQGIVELLMIAAYAIGARRLKTVEPAVGARKAWETYGGVPVLACCLWVVFAAVGPAKLANVDCSDPDAIHTKPDPAPVGPRVEAPRSQA